MVNRVRKHPVWLVTKEELVRIIEECSTLVEVLARFGRGSVGRNLDTLHARCREENISLDALRKRSHARIGHRKKIPLDQALRNPNVSRKLIKSRIMEEGLLENKCALCGQLPEWQGKPLVMVLDHVNGIANDHSLENLRLICPNCNSQLETFAAKNKRRTVKPVKVKVSREGKPLPLSVPELATLLWQVPTTEIAKKFGVTDSAVGKWARKHKLAKPPRGYWAKNAATLVPQVRERVRERVPYILSTEEQTTVES